jgi:YegS/Rv2252/BmrU family lipid kinase
MTPRGIGHEHPRRIRVLWNASAGRKAGIPTGSASRETLEALMARYGLGGELLETASEEAAIEAARDAAANGYHVVVAAGGDGTISVIGEVLLRTSTALGILPLGSIMNIPRMLGLPRDLEGAARVLQGGHTRRVDVGEANGRVFFEVASVGIHAAIFEEMAKADAGDLAGVVRSIMVAFRYRPSRMTIVLDDGREIETRALVVSIANGPYTGAGFTVAPDARLDDGRFDVRIFNRYSKRELVRHFAAIAFGRRAYAPMVATERSARVSITGTRPLPARADAQDLGMTPLTCTITPGALLVVAPDAADAPA